MIVPCVAQKCSQPDGRGLAARVPTPHQRQSFQGAKRCPT